MSKTGVLGVGIIGCGPAAAAHVRDYYSAAPSNARLLACADQDPNAARAFAERHAVEPSASVGDLLERTDIDAVDICTPFDTHAELVATALDANKHVLCEKPLTDSPEAVTSIIDLAHRRQREVGVVHNYRWRDEYVDAARLLMDGTLGAPRFMSLQVQVDWKAARGQSGADGFDLLVDLGYHHVDLARWLMRSDVVRVHAATGACFAVVTLTMATEAVAVVNIAGDARGTAANWGGSGVVQADGGTLYLNQPAPFALRVSSAVLGGRHDRNYAPKRYGPSGTAPFGPALAEFYAAVGVGRRPPVTAADTWNVVSTLLTARYSASTGESIDVPDMSPETGAEGIIWRRPAGAQ